MSAPVEAVEPRELTLPARDGYPLAVTRWQPRVSAGQVLLIPAVGVPRRFYRAFASYLAGRGLAVLCWDFRGIGESRRGPMRAVEASLTRWAQEDLGALLERAVAERQGGAPVFAVGHSFGGQAVGLVDAAAELSGLVLVASQSGYFGHWPHLWRYPFAALVHVAMPFLSRFLGYFPGRRLGLGGDLPRGVALEWARWCRTPEYLGRWEGHRRLALPVLAWSFDDDRYAPRRAVAALLAEYRAADIDWRHLAPAQAGARRIGHFDFFRSGVVPGLWEDTAGWLLARARGEAVAGARERKEAPGR